MTFADADFAAIERLWRRFFPDRYAVDAGLIRFNSVESPIFDWGASRLAVDGDEVRGFVLVKKSASPSLFRGPDPDQAHLSAIAFDDPGLGVDLLASTKRNLRERGIYRLVFGQDVRHFFPGCPDDCHHLKDFLRVEGFEETYCSFDLERDLGDYEPPAGCLDEREGVVFRALTMKDRHALAEFLEREFPGRWRHDVIDKVDAEAKADFVLGLFVNGRLEGFAMTQDSTHRAAVCGAVWKADLGESWGTLGPIGVSENVRGKGLGNAMLAYGLADLKKRGARKSLIDWTTLGEFYGRHGFEITRRYTGMALRLDI